MKRNAVTAMCRALAEIHVTGEIFSAGRVQIARNPRNLVIPRCSGLSKGLVFYRSDPPAATAPNLDLSLATILTCGSFVVVPCAGGGKERIAMSARFYRDDADAIPIDWVAWLLRALIAGTITVLAGVNNGIVLLF